MHVGIHFWSNKKNKNASNKENVYIKGSVHDAYLELPSSGTLKIKRLQSQIIYRCGSNKTNGPKLDSQIGYGHICLREKTVVLLIIILFRICKFQ
jgi:hypothetical protein